MHMGSRFVCVQCSQIKQKALRPQCRLTFRPKRQTNLRHASHFSYARRRAIPVKDIYDDLLSPGPEGVPQPLPPSPVSASVAPSPDPPEEDERVARARIIFGSRLAGPAERRRELDKASRHIAGILVPPRPVEPDNCCMSGCVNCVWDRYRDDIEEWAAKSAEARTAVAEQQAKGTSDISNAAREATIDQGAMSMDDDGGGSDTNWIMPQKKDLFEDIPVGIREFMRTEKKLKDRRRASPI